MGSNQSNKEKIVFPKELNEKLLKYIDNDGTHVRFISYDTTYAKFKFFLNSKLKIIDPEKHLKKDMFALEFTLFLEQKEFTLELEKIYNGITGQTKLALVFENERNIENKVYQEYSIICERILGLIYYSPAHFYELEEANSIFLDFLLSEREKSEPADVLFHLLCFLKNLNYEKFTKKD
jgi:hypothetical protein